MDTILDTLKTVGAGVGFTLALTIVISFINKGKFEDYGVKTGMFLSKLGRSKLGKLKWESLENVITMIILKFAKGLQIGLDLDDKIVEEEPAQTETKE